MIVPREFVVECYAQVFCICGWLYLGVVNCVSVCGGFLFGSDGEELALVGMELNFYTERTIKKKIHFILTKNVSDLCKNVNSRRYTTVVNGHDLKIAELIPITCNCELRGITLRLEDRRPLIVRF